MDSYRKNCLYCHRGFTASRSDQMYCSRRCWHKDNYAPAEKMTKVCPVCGKEFETPRTNMIFCNKSCRNAGVKEIGPDDRSLTPAQKADIVRNCQVVLLCEYEALVAKASSSGEVLILQYQPCSDDDDDTVCKLRYPHIHTRSRDPQKIVAEMNALSKKYKTIKREAVVFDSDDIHDGLP